MILHTIFVVVTFVSKKGVSIQHGRSNTATDSLANITISSTDYHVNELRFLQIFQDCVGYHAAILLLQTSGINNLFLCLSCMHKDPILDSK